MKTNITYIISNINKALAFEWISTYLNKDKFNLCFILLNHEDSELEDFLRKNNIPVERISFNGKKDILQAIYSVAKSLKRNKTQIVHTHLFEANLIGLFAAFLMKIPKRIHTRHHSVYHHIYYPKMVKYDRFVNFLSTHIIAVSKVVKDILVDKEKADPKKVCIIQHGFKLDAFDCVSDERVNNIKKRYNLNNVRKPVIGVISRYVDWKGIQYIVSAFKQILQANCNAHLILANANGPYKEEIQHVLKELPFENYTEIEFESDILALYKLFDVFIHVPVDKESEAFGQVYIEAMLSKVPCIVTSSGIASDFIENKRNALVVPFNNSKSIYNAFLELSDDVSLRNSIISNAEKDAKILFNIDKMIQSLEVLYEQ